MTPKRLRADLVAALKAVEDPSKRDAMRAYMKNDFVFLGVVAPARRTAMKEVLAASGLTRRTPVTTEWLTELSLSLWKGPEREIQYLAGDVLEFFAKSLTVDLLTTVVGPIFETTKPNSNWWDSVDLLVGSAVSPIGRANDLSALMRSWVAGSGKPIHKRADGSFSPELAKVRCAILHQLGRNGTTDEALLFELCAHRAADKEFFVAKAIGWALRDYSYTAPDAVEAFIKGHPELTPLAQREGLKAVLRRRSRVQE